MCGLKPSWAHSTRASLTPGEKGARGSRLMLELLISAAGRRSMAWLRRIVRQTFMNVCGRNRGVAGSDRDLVEVRYDVTGGIETGYVGGLECIDNEAAVRSRAGTEIDGKVRTRAASQRGIDAIEAQPFAIRERDVDVIASSRQLPGATLMGDAGFPQFHLCDSIELPSFAHQRDRCRIDAQEACFVERVPSLAQNSDV